MSSVHESSIPILVGGDYHISGRHINGLFPFRLGDPLSEILLSESLFGFRSCPCSYCRTDQGNAHLISPRDDNINMSLAAAALQTV